MLVLCLVSSHNPIPATVFSVWAIVTVIFSYIGSPQVKISQKVLGGGLLFLIHTVVYFIFKRSIVDQMNSANILQQISTLSQSHSVDVAVAPFFAAKPQTWNNLPDNAVSMYSLPSFHWQSFPNVMFRLSYIFCTDRESI